MLVLVGKQGTLLKILDTDDNTVDTVSNNFVQRSKQFVLGYKDAPIGLSSVATFWRYYAKYFFDTKGIREYMLGNHATTYPYLSTNVEGLVLRPIMRMNQRVIGKDYIQYDIVADVGFYVNQIVLECIKPVAKKDVTVIVPPFITEFDTVSTLFEDTKYSYVRKVELPMTVKVIKSNAFGLFSNLETVVIPNPDCVLEEAALSQSGIQYIELPKKLVELPYGAFQECTKLSSIKIPKTVTKLSSCVFTNCTALKEVTFDEGSKCKILGKDCFYGTAIEEFVCPADVELIDDAAFMYCRELRKIELSERLTNIGYYAFNYCTKLTELVIPRSVHYIALNAFNYSGIKRLIFKKGSFAYTQNLADALKEAKIECVFE